eukprot:4157484-Lingulodinium_polyedra.AAC.1
MAGSEGEFAPEDVNVWRRQLRKAKAPQAKQTQGLYFVSSQRGRVSKTRFWVVFLRRAAAKRRAGPL